MPAQELACDGSNTPIFTRAAALGSAGTVLAGTVLAGCAAGFAAGAAGRALVAGFGDDTACDEQPATVRPMTAASAATIARINSAPQPGRTQSPRRGPS